MTISSATRRAGPYIGDGVTTTFPFAFKAFTTADLLVIETTIATGVDLPALVLGSAYSVALNADQNNNPGGSVTLLGGPLAVGYELTITSNIAALQTSSIANQSGFYPKVIENGFDYLTVLIQQLQDKLARAITVPASEATALANLPGAISRQNLALVFDSNGEPTVGVPTTQTLTQSLLGQLLYGNQTANEAAVNVIPVNVFYGEGDARRYGFAADNNPATAAANTIALNKATKVCAYGKATLLLPPGTGYINGTWDCTSAGGGTTTNGGLTVKGAGKINSIIKYVAGANNAGIAWDQTGLAYGHFECFAFIGGSSTTNCPKVTLLQGAANAGAIATTNTLVGGSLYANGTYLAVPLTGGHGTGAQATVVVAGGAVNSVTITAAGSGYRAGDTLSASAASIGGSGSGFSVNVATIAGFIFSGNNLWIDVDLEGYGDNVWYCAGCEAQTFVDCTLIGWRNNTFGNAQPIVFVANASVPANTSAIVTTYSPVNSMTLIHWRGAKAALLFWGSAGINFHFSDGVGGHPAGACADIRFDDWFQVLTLSGAIATLNTLVGGALYTTGTYLNVPLTGGTGSGAQATVVVAGGAVTSVTVTAVGSGYSVSDVLSAAAVNIGGTGSGFTITVATLYNNAFKFMTDDSTGAAGTGLFNVGAERSIMEVATANQNLQMCDFSVALPKGIRFEGHAGAAHAISARPFQFEATAVPTECFFDWDPNESGSWTADYIVQCAGTENGISVRAPVPTANLVGVTNSRTIDGFPGFGYLASGTDYGQVIGTHLNIGPGANSQFNRVRKVRAGNFVSANSDWNEGVQTTQGVSTSAANILALPNYANLVIVTGADGSGNKFCDLLFCTFIATTTLATMAAAGSPAARTYTFTGNTLKCQVASGGPYAVQATCIGAGMQA